MLLLGRQENLQTEKPTCVEYEQGSATMPELSESQQGGYFFFLPPDQDYFCAVVRSNHS
jgi:hypothetical protein